MWINMDTVEVALVGLAVIWISHWVWRWKNPKLPNGVLPPGSMGFPLIGETLSLLTPSYSLDFHPFIRKRIQRYGPIFKTSVAGHPAVISADPEFNNFLFQQEGKLVELWYLNTFSKLFAFEGESRVNAAGSVHKYIRSIFLNCFGTESLKKLIPDIEEAVNETLSSWSTHDSIEVKHAASAMALNFSAKHTINYDAEKSTINLTDAYTKLSGSLLSFPLNVPGTTYNQCLKVRKRLESMFRAILNGRRTSPELHRGYLLDLVIKDIDIKEYLTEDLMVNLILVGLYATFNTISTVMALALKLLSEHPPVVEAMIAEHESIIKKREDSNSSLTWDDYKSMTFTLQVINETLRLASIAPGVIRKTLKDIPVKGFTIPKGWAIMLLTSSLHLNPNIYENPLEFNPWRWKELDSYVISKNFMPFGGGTRQCAGSEYSKVFMATFFHVLFTKYSWKVISMGKIGRDPNLGFGKGIHIKFSKKQN